MSTIKTTDGVEIFYKDWGNGQPIVFSHGWPLSADDWDSQMLFFLNQGYRVIAHDRRGHGRSSQTGDGHDMDHYADDLAALTSHLDLKDAIHVRISTTQARARYFGSLNSSGYSRRWRKRPLPGGIDLQNPVTSGGRKTAGTAESGSSTLSNSTNSPAADQVAEVAARSDIARYHWIGRGPAPAGYIKGMALVYARVYCKLKAGDSAAAIMARANTHDAARDALAWYGEEFAALGMSNDLFGVDTLRHLFVLLVGLGMRESSGRYCEGRDRSASNTKAETAEAGLFQTSFNIREASPELPKLFARYSASPSGLKDVFREGVRCTAADRRNYGSGPGVEFQRLSKECPAFAAEFAAVGLRADRTHWGPINSKAAEIRPEFDAMLKQIQNLMDASRSLR